MSGVDILQWTGCVLLLATYCLYRYGGLAAPMTGIVANAVFIPWAIATENWGLLTVGVILCLVNAWTLRSWLDERAARGFWRQ